jgi:biopolymer transport protein ExbD
MSQIPGQPKPLSSSASAGISAAVTAAAPAQETIHHHRRQGKKKSPTNMELNMTSMIDVVFQLLIYFIITSNFVPGEGIIQATMPAGTGSAAEVPKLEQPIKIIVSARSGRTGSGYRLDVDKSAIAPSTFGDLGKMLEGMREDKGGAFSDENPIIIQPSGDVRWQHVVNAFNAAVKARYKNIAFAQATGGEGG